ncbi:hypothetical protein CVU75_02190 [Candidatus Dependentiae bacterium HGW-Dependentiae-1]|nr:MAG: hypothetical protein CVU75_02190 [Candidatus Dependentiae bacterium HGW-Dependentiae-1]
MTTGLFTVIQKLSRPQQTTKTPPTTRTKLRTKTIISSQEKNKHHHMHIFFRCIQPLYYFKNFHAHNLAIKQVKHIPCFFMIDYFSAKVPCPPYYFFLRPQHLMPFCYA